MRRWLLLILVAVAGGLLLLFLPEAGPQPVSINYCGNLSLDIAVPKGNGPFPLIVCIHGGAWHSGGKSQYGNMLVEFSRHGYVAASVDYRLAPANKFPAQIEDVKCAVRFLRAHATEYHIDPQRVGALGESAGGHLALLLGLMNPGDGLEGGCGDQPSKVQAVVNYYGPSDLSAPENWGSGQIAQAKMLLGTTDPKDPIVTRASPIAYIDSTDPPILTFHGDADPIVPVSQARRLHEALRRAGVPERLEIVRGAGHGWTGNDAERITRMTIEFFDTQLKAR
ncbi:MAG TPA: alpha/beta hydrolase [Planctomycetota bacterium]|jgi:acetyl esterase/lipase